MLLTSENHTSLEDPLRLKAALLLFATTTCAGRNPLVWAAILKKTPSVQPPSASTALESHFDLPEQLAALEGADRRCGREAC